MRVLLIKTSSLGDVIHTFPAVTELQNLNVELKLDWVVERSFAHLPEWHPQVRDVIPVDMRAWRKKIWSPTTRREWAQFVERMRRYRYDIVIDAQGLLKSALITRKAFGIKHGLDWQSAWEPLASTVYDVKHSVDPSLHAIHRMQTLFGEIFDYAPGYHNLDYGIDKRKLIEQADIPNEAYLVFVHATTWDSKHWPIEYWADLAKVATANGFKVLLPWGNDAEKQRAELIAQGRQRVEVLPKMNLTALSGLLAASQGVVAVDTGLAHISAALDVPLVSLYGPTDPAQTGTLSNSCKVLHADFACAPCAKPTCQFKGESSVKPACFEGITPSRVWQALTDLHRRDERHENIRHHNDLQSV